MRRISSLIVLGVLWTVPAGAQQPPAPVTPVPVRDSLAQARSTTPPRPTPPAPPPGSPGEPQAPPPAPPAPPAPRGPVASQSVRVEVTITDSLSAGTPIKKTVTLLVADGQSGRVRSTNFLRLPAGQDVIVAGPGGPPGPNPVTLNVDAIPYVRADSRIMLQLTMEYMPNASAGSQEARPGSISESLTVLIPEGQSTMVSQSADPVTDRKVTVEVKATIVK